MKWIKLGSLCGFCLTVALASNAPNRAHAAIVLTDMSFEDGLSGWSVSGRGKATTTTGFGIYAPQGGASFLKLTVGAGKSLTVYQDFTATAGDTLNGWAGMISAKRNSKDVALLLTIYNDLGEYVWSSNDTNSPTPGVGGQQSSKKTRLKRLTKSTKGWQAWEWIAPESGHYRLQYSLQNYGTTKSTAVFDAPVMHTPIPPTALLLASGLVGLGALRRRLARKESC